MNGYKTISFHLKAELIKPYRLYLMVSVILMASLYLLEALIDTHPFYVTTFTNVSPYTFLSAMSWLIRYYLIIFSIILYSTIYKDYVALGKIYNQFSIDRYTCHRIFFKGLIQLFFVCTALGLFFGIILSKFSYMLVIRLTGILWRPSRIFIDHHILIALLKFSLLNFLGILLFLFLVIIQQKDKIRYHKFKTNNYIISYFFIIMIPIIYYLVYYNIRSLTNISQLIYHLLAMVCLFLIAVLLSIKEMVPLILSFYYNKKYYKTGWEYFWYQKMRSILAQDYWLIFFMVILYTISFFVGAITLEATKVFDTSWIHQFSYQGEFVFTSVLQLTQKNIDDQIMEVILYLSVSFVSLLIFGVTSTIFYMKQWLRRNYIEEELHVFKQLMISKEMYVQYLKQSYRFLLWGSLLLSILNSFFLLYCYQLWLPLLEYKKIFIYYIAVILGYIVVEHLLFNYYMKALKKYIKVH